MTRASDPTEGGGPLPEEWEEHAVQETLSMISELVDPIRCETVLGRRVRATRLRVKPGTSLLAGLVDSATEEQDGWARILWPEQADKATKVLARARRRGLRADLRSLGGGFQALVGETATDPGLSEHFRAVAGTLDVRAASTRIVRYNPSRRLVAHVDGQAMRVSTSAMDGEVALLRTLTEVGVPVVPRLDDGSEPHLARYPWVGNGDLSEDTSSEHAREAGRMLAQLHHALPAVSALPAGVRPQPMAVREPLEAIVRELALCGEETVAQGRWVRDTLLRRWSAIRPGLRTRPVLLHGDASGDQVLRDDRTGQMWLTDLDRATIGPAAVDLGTYQAVLEKEFGSVTSTLLGEELLRGYRRAGGRVRRKDIDLARVRALFLRSTEPLRQANPTWRTAVRHSVQDCAELLS